MAVLFGISTICYPIDSMKKRQTVFVSNRLAVSVAREGDEITFRRSVGGLATGLSSVSSGDEHPLWVGWSGVLDDEVNAGQRREITSRLRCEHHAVAVPLTGEEFEPFYSGFCNDTIWPLFHYFPTIARYNHAWWEGYRLVNERFFKTLQTVLRPGARVWVHDYHLFLLPELIKRHFPTVEVGFFLHIPFPSYELFRLLPWREEILNGVLGADLIGFHTYDYARHFLSSVRRLLGYDHSMGVIRAARRAVKVDVFPMGIDWDRYVNAGRTDAVREIASSIGSRYAGQRLVLSVDRLDYSKGIPSRIRAFGRFLDRYPDYHQRVTLIMIVSPSRESVPHYVELRREVEELVSQINGRLSTLDWVPIHYHYQTASFEELSALYRAAEVLLVTPLRDGMNLIAKEYLAARTDNHGCVVLSETAGAARELSEAILVNPSDIDGIADALHEGLTQPRARQEANLERMRGRIQRLTVQRWAADFLEKLDDTRAMQASFRAQPLGHEEEREIVSRWKASQERIILLDYDGTLVPFFRHPEMARPDGELQELLRELSASGATVVISSGRDRDNLERWLGDLPVGMGAGHGAWIRPIDGAWQAASVSVPEWKEEIEPIMQRTVDRTPGSHLEYKAFSLAWHYRNCEPELAAVRLSELRETLIGLTDNLELSVLDGNRVLEVKPAHIHKGRVVNEFLSHAHYDICVAIGDDATDEYMFQALTTGAVSIKVGVGTTAARYSIDGVKEVRALLSRLAEG